MPIAKPFQKWVAKLIKDIQRQRQYDGQQLKEMLERATVENEESVRKAKHDALCDAFHRKHHR